MKVNVPNAVNFNVDRKLVDFIQERLDKLEKILRQSSFGRSFPEA